LLGNNHHSGKGKAIFLYFEKCDGKLIHRTVRAAAHRTFRARWLLIVIMRLPLAILESPCSCGAVRVGDLDLVGRRRQRGAELIVVGLDAASVHLFHGARITKADLRSVRTARSASALRSAGEESLQRPSHNRPTIGESWPGSCKTFLAFRREQTRPERHRRRKLWSRRL
jgi:hypothetical protein